MKIDMAVQKTPLVWSLSIGNVGTLDHPPVLGFSICRLGVKLNTCLTVLLWRINYIILLNA